MPVHATLHCVTAAHSISATFKVPSLCCLCCLCACGDTERAGLSCFKTCFEAPRVGTFDESQRPFSFLLTPACAISILLF